MPHDFLPISCRYLKMRISAEDTNDHLSIYMIFSSILPENIFKIPLFACKLTEYEKFIRFHVDSIKL